MSQVPGQPLLRDLSILDYLELTASFAQTRMAKGRRNQKIHAAFSSLRQIAASALSGNKLILTIPFPPLDFYSSRGIDYPPLKSILMGEIVRSGQNEKTQAPRAGAERGGGKGEWLKTAGVHSTRKKGRYPLWGCGIDSSTKTSLDISSQVRKIDYRKK
jgi:hypothetical protein